jgi:hypothetical protein
MHQIMDKQAMADKILSLQIDEHSLFTTPSHVSMLIRPSGYQLMS